MSANKPRWMRVDVNIIANPKLQRAIRLGGAEAALLYLEALGYSVGNLTDGWIPEGMPSRWGYGEEQVAALLATVLWFEVPISDEGGWLINDYHEYQPTRPDWERRSEAGRIAAAARWASKNHAGR